MNILALKEKLSKSYPFMQLDFDENENILILKNIISSKRFDMGYGWDCFLHVKDENIIKKVYKLRTYDNIRADFSKEIEPTKEVEKKLKSVLNLLKLKENPL